MALRTHVYDFNEGAAGAPFVPGHPDTTVYDDLYYSPTSVTGLGVSSAVAAEDDAELTRFGPVTPVLGVSPGVVELVGGPNVWDHKETQAEGDASYARSTAIRGFFHAPQVSGPDWATATGAVVSLRIRKPFFGNARVYVYCMPADAVLFGDQDQIGVFDIHDVVADWTDFEVPITGGPSSAAAILASGDPVWVRFDSIDGVNDYQISQINVSAGQETSIGTIVQRFAGPGFASVRAVWDSIPAYSEAYPVYEEFLALVVSAFGSEEAGLVAFNNELNRPLPITRYSARILVTEHPFSLVYTANVLKMSFGDGQLEATLQLYFFSYNSGTGPQVGAAWREERLDGSTNSTIPGPIPQDEWLRVEASHIGDTATITLLTEAGAILATQSSVMPGIWERTETTVFQASHTSYIDDLSWTYETPEETEIYSALQGTRRRFS